MSNDRLKVGEHLVTAMRYHGEPVCMADCEMSRLFFKHKAGKCKEHGPLYEALLWPLTKKPDVRFLEIGIGEGGSLAAFAEFLPDAKLFGIDYSTQTSDHACILHGDQSDPAFMDYAVRILGQLDFVIDDGGHHANDQQVSFEALWPIVKRGGHYVIEDLHVCEAKNFKVDGRPTTLEYIDSLGLNPAFHYCQEFDRDICVIEKL